MRRNWIFRDRTHSFDTNIRWWIHFQEIQIQTRRKCDHNWLHWVGHCDQQSYRFLKLRPLLHVSLVTQRSSPVVAVFKMCVIGVGQTRPLQRPPLCITLCGKHFGYPWLFKKWKSGRKSQNQQNFQCSRRPTASSRQKARPISVQFMRSFVMHCSWNNGFSHSKNKNKRLAV